MQDINFGTHARPIEHAQSTIIAIATSISCVPEPTDVKISESQRLRYWPLTSAL
jgi:hypothetical protein